MVSDYTAFSLLTNAFFVNCHFFLDSCVKMSFLDLVFLTETDNYTEARELFDFIMWDMLSFVSTNFYFSQFLFYTNYQDLFVTILYHSPELVLALADFFNSYWFSNIMSYVPSAIFDVYADNLYSSLESFLKIGYLYLLFVWIMIICTSFFRNLAWSISNNPYAIRLMYSMYSSSRQTRFLYEAVIQSFYLIVLYFSMAIITFDDDDEEGIEGVNSSLVRLFFGCTLYFLFRMSIHFFSYLEASVSGGRTMWIVMTQFRRDFINTIAFLARFGILLLRLNIYDMIDDILDSYYIFLCDFTDDEYFTDLFFVSSSIRFFDTDNKDDRSFFLEGEVDLSADLFSLYFNIWGKFSLFWFFFAEEIGRVFVAFYITFLMVFEASVVNRSYVEDTYIATKRTKAKTNNQPLTFL